MEKRKVEKNFFTSSRIIIGKDDHEFIALIDLYKMNSDGYDFAKIRFMSGTSWFYDSENKLHRIYMDNEYNSYNGKLKALVNDKVQTLTINRLSFCMPTEARPGRITMKYSITDRSGSNEITGFKYDILEWNSNYVIEGRKEEVDNPVTITEEIGEKEDIIAEVTLTKSASGNQYNKAAIQFIYKPDCEKFFYCSGDAGCGDTIYLFDHSFCKYDNFTMCINCFDCEESSNIRLIIHDLKLKLATHDECGEIYIDAVYKHGETTEEMNRSLVKWKMNGDKC